MKRLEIDSRITSAERIDPAKTVLVDAYSLATLATQLTTDEIPTLDASALYKEPGGPTLANIIQAIILYDSIVVDSLLFEVKSDVGTAEELFPGVIRGIFVRPLLRLEIGKIVSQVSGMYFERPPEIDAELWTHSQRRAGGEKPLMDEMAAVSPKMIPAEYSQDQEIIKYFDREDAWSFMPPCCLNSMMTYGRAHFYLELARNLRLPLATDPARSKYFDLLVRNTQQDFIRGFPEEAIARFENNFWRRNEYENLINYSALIPPVAELALRYAVKNKIPLRVAVTEIRNSENAVAFRKWCERFQTLRLAVNRPNVVELEEMLKELDSVCLKWSKDVGESVNYKIRTLKLACLPLIGKVLEAVGMDKVTVKDPILIPENDRGYFLFLNDLLKAPRERV